MGHPCESSLLGDTVNGADERGAIGFAEQVLELELFLFGANRTQTAKVRAGLWEVQGRRCFYCDARIAEPTGGHVDHFVPWSRYPDDTLDNFVVADKKCNGFKSSSLAAADHLTRWTRRFADGSSEQAQLSDLAHRVVWDRQPDRSLNIARAIYLRLPNDARLWLRAKEFVSPDSLTIGTALNVPRHGTDVVPTV
jgi:hypothetical protein